jgi:dTDP-4-dehydrorhamnose reductase
MIKVLVTGSNGQLGSELQRLAPAQTDMTFVFTTRDTMPLENTAAIELIFEKEQPDFCINCAAYTAVDKAETDESAAMAANATAVGQLAKICFDNKCRLIHVSTDYVFDGTATEPIPEDSALHPLGVYGLSKAEGERLAQLNDPSSIIIRTSWVYSSFGNNFVKTMLRLMRQREKIGVVNDQIGSPTFALDLASAIIIMIRQLGASGKEKTGGVYHYANEGVISWYDFALAIREHARLSCAVEPIPSSAYPTPAKRPAYSVFAKEKIKRDFSVHIPDWRDSLQLCMTELLKDFAV